MNNYDLMEIAIISHDFYVAFDINIIRVFGLFVGDVVCEDDGIYTGFFIKNSYSLFTTPRRKQVAYVAFNRKERRQSIL